jgi:hypothetical protein
MISFLEFAPHCFSKDMIVKTDSASVSLYLSIAPSNLYRITSSKIRYSNVSMLFTPTMYPCQCDARLHANPKPHVRIPLKSLFRICLYFYRDICMFVFLKSYLSSPAGTKSRAMGASCVQARTHRCSLAVVVARIARADRDWIRLDIIGSTACPYVDDARCCDALPPANACLPGGWRALARRVPEPR